MFALVLTVMGSFVRIVHISNEIFLHSFISEYMKPIFFVLDIFGVGFKNIFVPAYYFPR